MANSISSRIHGLGKQLQTPFLRLFIRPGIRSNSYLPSRTLPLRRRRLFVKDVDAHPAKIHGRWFRDQT